MRKKIYRVIEIADINDKWSRYYDRSMLFLIICSIIPLCFKTQNTAFIWVERITVTIFIIDYFLRWATADFKLRGYGKMAFLRYPFTLFAIFDLLSILPSLAFLDSGFKLFRLFRLNKAFKTLRILRYSESFRIILSVVHREKQSLLAVSYLAVGYVFLSALLMFQVEPESFETFFDAIYWAVITLTTVGYGDIHPVSGIGQMVSMVSSFVGLAVVALPTAILTARYITELNRKKEKK